MKVSELIKRLDVTDLDKNVIVTETEIFFPDTKVTDLPSVGCKDGVCEINYKE